MTPIKAAIAAALIATSASAEVITMTDKDLTGGGVSKHYNRVMAINERGDTVRLDARSISSAGTFYLMANGACIVDPDTSVEFHGPQSGAGIAFFAITGVPVSGSWMPKEKADWIRSEMATFYNSGYPGLGDWFLDRAAHKGGMYVTRVKAHELSRAFGVRICEE